MNNGPYLSAWNVLSLGTYVPWDVLSLGTFCLWTFCLWDVLSLGRCFVPGTFCPLWRFVPFDVLSLVTFCPLGHFVLGRFVLGRFVLGGFVSGRFVCASLSVLKQHFFKRYHYPNLQKRKYLQGEFSDLLFISRGGQSKAFILLALLLFSKAFRAVVDK